VGIKSINPWNLNLISSGINADPYAGHVAWLFFRDSSWGIPLADNPRYGLEAASSLVYSDSIPLIAIPMKFLAQYTRAEVQYFGIWLLICFLCQSKITWDFISIYTKSVSVRSLTSILSSTFPVFLWRIQAHFSLTGQFLIIYALKLCFHPKQGRAQRRNWLALLGVAALVHPYFLAICGFMFMVRILQEAFGEWQEKKTSSITALQAFLVVGIVTILIAGYDIKSSNSMVGTNVEYGTYRFNWLSPLTPNGWSAILRNLNLPLTNFETFSYLGLGVYLICLCALISIIVKRRFLIKSMNAKRFTFISIFLMALFAGTNKIAVGRWELFLPIPEYFKEISSIFSASARFALPMLYAIFFISIIVLIKVKSRILLLSVLIFATSIQLVDVSKGISEIRSRVDNSDYKAIYNGFTDSTWQSLRQNYTIIRVPLAGRENYGFPQMALISIRFGFETNSFYFGRVNPEGKERSNYNYNRAVNSYVFEPETIYVITNDELRRRLESVPKLRNRIIHVDSYYLLAP